MASITGGTRPEDHIVEEFKPISWWLQDLNCHYLFVDVPDFKIEEIKMQIDGTDHVMVSGEKLAKDDKCIYFKETFKVPKNSDIENISGRLEEGILTLAVPKRTTTAVEKNLEQYFKKKSDNEAQKPPESETRERKESFYSAEIIEKRGEERSIFKSTMKMVNNNRGVIITAVLAFALVIQSIRKKMM